MQHIIVFLYKDIITINYERFFQECESDVVEQTKLQKRGLADNEINLNQKNIQLNINNNMFFHLVHYIFVI